MPANSDTRWRFPAPTLGGLAEPDDSVLSRDADSSTIMSAPSSGAEPSEQEAQDNPEQGAYPLSETPACPDTPAYPLATRPRRQAPAVYEPRHFNGRTIGAHGGSQLTLDMTAPAVPATVHVVHTHIVRVEQVPSQLALPSPRRRWLGRLGHAATLVASPALAVAATLWFTSGRSEVREITQIIERAVPILPASGPRNLSTPPAPGIAADKPAQLAAAGSAGAVAASLPKDRDDTNPAAQLDDKAKAKPAPKSMSLENLPAVVSATGKAIRTGVAQPWEGMGMSGYAVAGPVRLNGQQTCRRIAIWVDGQGPGANALGADRCLASDGSWTAPVESQPSLTASSMSAALP